MMSKNNKPTYISRVHLKGYKSIRDLSIDLLPGLNIIIGLNGSGKTNFLEFLDAAQLGEIHLTEPHEFSIEIIDSKENKFIRSKRVDKIVRDLQINILEDKDEWNEQLFKNGKEIIDENVNDNKYFIQRNLMRELSVDFRKVFHPRFLSFALPKDISYIHNNAYFTYNFKTKKVGASRHFFSPFIQNSPFEKIQYDFKSFTKDVVFKELAIKPELINNLKSFSPIENIRLRDGFIFNKTEYEVFIDQLFLEFFVNNTWLSWNQLSDGTKRIFFIITQITANNSLILLEEPELGIHPHQLRLLMKFLREQSENKQIIISTHAPQVLNILDEDELERIILTEFSPENGTTMHHLTAGQIAQSRDYMTTEGLFLSDYWLYSNLLEKEIA
jgi:AAA15 family ATPase/GTPase